MAGEKSSAGGFADQLRFLQGLIARPRATGAVSPSGAALTRRMASHVDPAGDLPIVELGPGTGVVTKALLERGVKPSRIVAIEYSPEFCALLRERFPGITVIEGDAYDLDRTLPSSIGRLAGVVSSLPLVARPLEDRQRLIMMGLDRLPASQPFVQFSYLRAGPVAPVPGRFTAEASPWIWMNVPPARVWLYRRAAV